MKIWRKNRTTIVITHDLSQIVSDDFVYVMKDGLVAEQGFRSDLMKKTPVYGQQYGVFAAMAAEQTVEPLPPKMEEWPKGPEEDQILDGETVGEPDIGDRPRAPSLAVTLRPNSVMYLDILEDYVRGGRSSVIDDRWDSRRLSRPLSIAQKRLSWTPPELDQGRRHSRSSVIYGRPTSRMSHQLSYRRSSSYGHDRLDEGMEVLATEKDEINTLRHDYQQNRTPSSKLDDGFKKEDLAIAVDTQPTAAPPNKKIRGVFALIAHFYPTLPSKHLLFLGVLGSVGHGVITPIWASFLARLMQIVGAGGTSPNLTRYGIIALGLCAVQGLADFAQEYSLYALSAKWAASVRGTAFGSVVRQDNAWFDESANSPARLVQCLIKDADDMRALMGSVIGKMVVFVAMVGLGIVWAMIISWRLTLIGVAIAPVFAVLLVINEAVIGKAEVVNKAKREAVARTFYEVCPTAALRS